MRMYALGVHCPSNEFNDVVDIVIPSRKVNWTELTHWNDWTENERKQRNATKAWTNGVKSNFLLYKKLNKRMHLVIEQTERNPALENSGEDHS